MDDDIHRLARRRQELWAAGVPAKDEVTALAVRLEDAYKDKRQRDARARRGGRSDEQIRSTARVHSELDRLTNR